MSIEQWISITYENTKQSSALGQSSASENTGQKQLKQEKPLVKPNPYMALIHQNEEALSQSLLNWIDYEAYSPTVKFYIVTFSFTVSQMRTYNNAQLSSLFCYKFFNLCKLMKIKTQYVREYTKADVPHFHALIAFDTDLVDVTKLRNKLFNMLGDTLIGNVNPNLAQYIEEQWKKKQGKEYKVQTRTRDVKMVTDYLSKITSKKKEDWFKTFDHNYVLL